MVVAIILDDRNHVRKVTLHTNVENAQMKAQMLLNEILVWYKADNSPMMARTSKDETVQIWKPFQMD